MRRYGLRDYQSARISTCSPRREGAVGAIATDNSRLVEAVLYRDRAGMHWRDLPDRFIDWNNTHRRFSRWAKCGVCKRMCQGLVADAVNEYAKLDSTIVRAHQHSAGAKKRTRRGPGDRSLSSLSGFRLMDKWIARRRTGNGGAEGDRTPDLLIANEALSQLSYSPIPRRAENADRGERSQATAGHGRSDTRPPTAPDRGSTSTTRSGPPPCNSSAS